MKSTNGHMMPFKRISIVANQSKDPDLDYLSCVLLFLKDRGIEVSLDRVSEGSAFCVVLGGDGTMLRVAPDAAILDIPMLGINLGTLGFLTDVDKQDGLASLGKVLAGEFSKDSRIMLEADFGDSAVEFKNRLALNEVCVGNTGQLKVFSVYINDQYMDEIRADGIVIATPTGSTAYNLSAGGPILVPGGQMMVVTPICPHSLSSRPWVISADDQVRIVCRQVSPLYIDGENRCTIAEGGDVLIKKSTYHATIIKTAPMNFYAVLRKKKLL